MLCLLYTSRKMLCTLVEKSCARPHARSLEETFTGPINDPRFPVWGICQREYVPCKCPFPTWHRMSKHVYIGVRAAISETKINDDYHQGQHYFCELREIPYQTQGVVESEWLSRHLRLTCKSTKERERKRKREREREREGDIIRFNII